VARAAAALDYSSEGDPDRQTDEEDSGGANNVVEDIDDIGADQALSEDELPSYELAAFGSGGEPQCFPQPGGVW
jgi:hypothetical protein